MKAVNYEANPNLTWASVVVDELVRAGLQAVCISPGSRSTPLALAFYAHPAVRLYRHLDERSAAFFALGMALEKDQPVALVCTSGTAAANYFPALIEARMSQVPLLLLTADRPPELRHSGANQTIDQVKIYGDQVLWSVDVALPDAAAPGVVLRSLRTLAARAYATANGLVKGPVHLNFPFRKPLEPPPETAAHWEPPVAPAASASAHTQFGRGVLLPSEEQGAFLAGIIRQHERGLIVCGPRCPGADFAAAVAALSRQAGYPLLADPLSGVRFGPWVPQTAVLSGYETYLQGDPGWREPQVVLRFGAVPTSKWLNHYLDRIRPAYRFHVRQNGVWADDSHRVSHFWQVQEAALCRAVAQRVPPRPQSSWQAQVVATETAVWQAMAAALHEGDFFDGAAVYDLVTRLPETIRLLAGNSLPVRHLDQFGRGGSKRLHAHAHRGASGIDGNISSGLGLAAAAGTPTVIVVGDVTFYHDLNGLLAIHAPQGYGKEKPAPAALKNVTLVLLNNGGGGIFRRLPIRAFEPLFTDLFLTPHGLDFAPAARLFGWEFERVESAASFRTAFTASLNRATPGIIEVRTDSALDARRRREVVKIGLAAVAT